MTFRKLIIVAVLAQETEIVGFSSEEVSIFIHSTT